MSAVRRNDFEMIWGGKIIRVRNRIQAKKGGKKKFLTQISKGRKKAKWRKTGESNLQDSK